MVTPSQQAEMIKSLGEELIRVGSIFRLHPLSYEQMFNHAGSNFTFPIILAATLNQFSRQGESTAFPAVIVSNKFSMKEGMTPRLDISLEIRSYM